MRQQFIEFSLQAGVLRFGEFKTKAGRLSPYFFNAGLFNRGHAGAARAILRQTLLDAGVEFDMLFGPAYKGITLAAATAVALADKGRNTLRLQPQGSQGPRRGRHHRRRPLAGQGRDRRRRDSAGTSVRESVDLIRAAGAEPCAVLIALDRMERSGTDGALSASSAVQEVSREFGIPVISIGRPG